MCNDATGSMVNQTESVLPFRLLQRSLLSQKNLLNQSLRAFAAVELKSYNAILAPLILQNQHTAVEAKPKYLADLLQCTSIDVHCSTHLNKNNNFLCSNRIKIIPLSPFFHSFISFLLHRHSQSPFPSLSSPKSLLPITVAHHRRRHRPAQPSPRRPSPSQTSPRQRRPSPSSLNQPTPSPS